MKYAVQNFLIVTWLLNFLWYIKIYCIRSGIKTMPVNRGRIPTVNCFEKGFSKQMRISKKGGEPPLRSKKSGAVLCRHYASWCIPLKDKENAVDHAKYTMPHRISGGSSIAVNASKNLADLQKLYHCCKNRVIVSRDIAVLFVTNLKSF